MDNQTVSRIRSSFALLAPRGQEVIDTFYEMLFSKAPGVRALFPRDMAKQKGHLLAAVGLVVKHADNLGELSKPLAEMGQRHVKYGAQPEHYPVVRDTMVEALAKVAGPVWNAQLAADWTGALNAVAAAMLAKADQRKAA